MKDAPVNDVFQKRPDQDAECKQPDHEKHRQAPFPPRLVKKVGNYRQVNDQRCGRMHMRKKLHETALEHRHAFILI